MNGQSEFERLLQRSAELHKALDEHLAGAEFDDSPHTRITLATSGVAVEHGVSICILTEAGNLTSANALLRSQFEATIRAFWLWLVATDDRIERYIRAVRENPLKDPNMSPGMDEMLKAIGENDPKLAPQFVALKAAAWGPLNSFVHAGMQTVALQHAGFQFSVADGTVRNSNGLTTMAFGVMTALSGDHERAKGIGEIQRRFQDCCPPAAT